MIKTSPNDTNQLSTSVDHPQVWPLVVTPVPLLCALLHLSHVVGSQRQVLETTTSGHRTRRNKVVQQQGVKGTECIPRTLYSLIYGLGRRIDRIGIIAGGPGVLDVEPRLELPEALRASIVNILGIGDKLRRRRSVGSRHFVWRTGQWCKAQQLTLFLTAHVRHGLIWSSLPLPWDSSICQLDKPQIFFTHSDPKPFGVWCYFYLHLTHLCSIFVTPLSSDPPLSPIAPL